MSLFLDQLFETNIICETKGIGAQVTDWSRKLEVRQGRITKLSSVPDSWDSLNRDRLEFATDSIWSYILRSGELSVHFAKSEIINL